MLRKTIALTFVALVACSGDDASSGGVTPETACNDASDAYCSKINECAPFLVTLSYGDIAACIARTKINCVASFSATGSSATPARLSQCAADAKAAACDDLLARQSPPSCVTLPGTLADGVGCGVNAQCAGKLCRQTGNDVCGVCSTAIGAGGTCEHDDDCDTGLVCASKRCVALAKAGNACSASQPCIRTLACVNSVCSAALKAGAACTSVAGDNPCDAAHGLYCDAQTKVCASITAASAGASCGVTTGGTVLCAGAAKCKQSSPTTPGTCLAPAADGATCDDVNGPTCVSPARCISGLCKITDPTTCK